MRNILLLARTHLRGDKKTWEKLANMSRMEAESDAKLIKKINKVI